MIHGRMAAFLRLCDRRGVTFDNVKACVVAQHDDMVVVDELHEAYPWETSAAREAAHAAALRIPKSTGPGAELKALLSKMGFSASESCACNKRAQVMNEKGIQWCEENIETICDWLAEESAKRNLPFIRSAGKLLIRMAIRNAKKGTDK